MNNLVQLRQEIAKMRLMDLAKEYGKDSERVNNYRKRVNETDMTKEVTKTTVSQQKPVTLPHQWAGNY